MKVLMTGHRGYIGSVMGPIFERAGHEVTGLDTGYFDPCLLGMEPETGIRYIRKDLRELEPDDLQGYDAVVHLAALSNDPIGNLNESWTREINFEGSVRLAELAKAAGVCRFLFSSSCIMYGISGLAVVNEDSPLDPKTEYARSKVKAEEGIRRIASSTFWPVFLRNGTIYGFSPRMRFDTVLNDFVGRAAATRRITVMGGGAPWRPVVHVEDVSRAFLAVLEAPREALRGEAYNLGTNDLNIQILRLAEIAAGQCDSCELEVLHGEGTDQRTYWTDFAKFARTFPDFQFRWNPVTGATDLYTRLQRLGLRANDFNDPRFTRLKWLNHLMETHQLDQHLRWKTAAGVAVP